MTALEHNTKLFAEWLTARGIRSSIPPVSSQTEILPILGDLWGYGYNPSIIRYDGKILMAYRWHSEGNLETALAMVELDEAGVVLSKSDIKVERRDGSAEDPRLFVFQDELYCAWVHSNSPDRPMACQMNYGRLIWQDGEWLLKGWKMQTNAGGALEKNWVPFPGTVLNFIYRQQPVQIILQFIEGQVVHELDSPGPTWAWGEIKGGTTPMPYQGQLLRFFHSTLDNEPPPWRRRYYVGAALMKPEAQLETIKT